MKRVAVIGAGTMGSGISEHIAGIGCKVLLFDIMKDNTLVAREVINKMKRGGDITPLNVEKDLHKVSDMDWIIEVVTEDLSLKKKIYSELEKHHKTGTIISSNTSTLTRKMLLEGSSDKFKEHFFITHFFNPVGYLSLMELVTGEENSPNMVTRLRDFCDLSLGRYVIDCNDTPGFIANRIGCFWLMTAIVKAIDYNISIGDADSIMRSRHIGIPRTGVFALLDLIGLDVFFYIVNLLKLSLPKDDPISLYSEPKILTEMIYDGFTGSKARGGFYKKSDLGEMQCIDLNTGLYVKCKRQNNPISASNIFNLFTSTGVLGSYVHDVMSQTIGYAASLIPEIANDAPSVDRAMRLGYNWSFGPFELLDKIYFAKNKPASINIEKLAGSSGKSHILDHNRSIYKNKKHLSLDGEYRENSTPGGMWSLRDKKSKQKAILKNNSGSLWDLGDGVACFSFTSRNNVFDLSVLRLLNDSINIVEKHFAGMIIGNDVDNFSVGVNLKLFIKQSLADVRYMIEYGQKTFERIKYSDFPCVAAVKGHTVGGGCEIMLHCDGIQAYNNTYSGLVETKIGVIPGWGGCKEMLLRFSGASIKQLFLQIFLAQLSSNAHHMQDMRMLQEDDRISTNIHRLLSDAKQYVLDILKVGYEKRKQEKILVKKVDFDFKTLLPDDATEHDRYIGQVLLYVLDSAGATQDVVLNKERDGFMTLMSEQKTIDRISHMLYKKSQLRN